MEKWSGGVYQIHWHLQNTSTPLVCVSPSTCHLSIRWRCGRREEIHLSLCWAVRGLIARQQLMCHLWLMSHEVTGGRKWRSERERGRKSRASWGFFCAAVLSSLWSSDILPSTALFLSLHPLQLSFLSISCPWLQAVAAVEHKLPCIHSFSACQAFQTG